MLILLAVRVDFRTFSGVRQAQQAEQSQDSPRQIAVVPYSTERCRSINEAAYDISPHNDQWRLTGLGVFCVLVRPQPLPWKLCFSKTSSTQSVSVVGNLTRRFVVSVASPISTSTETSMRPDRRSLMRFLFVICLTCVGTLN